MKRSEAFRELERVAFSAWGAKNTGRILRALSGQYEQGLSYPNKQLCKWLREMSYACDKLSAAREDDVK